MKLPPLGNPMFSATMVGENLLSTEECRRLRSRLDHGAWKAAGVTNEAHPGGVIDAYARSVLAQAVPLEPDGWPLTAIRSVISEINASTWRFDLDGFTPFDYPSVLRYEAGAADHFHPHTDIGKEHPTRKLSFSLQLSDPSEYRGGELIFEDQATDPRMRNQGTMTVFPSMLRHEVTPVVLGTRLAIVGWVHGPTFR